MATALTQAQTPGFAAIERVLIAGDLAPLNTEQRVEYYNRVCQSLGLNPLTKPFAYIALNSKLLLYATRDCTDQLRRIHGVSIALTERKVIEGVCVVQARATDKTGRTDEATGAVNVAGLRADALANAIMKAETKAKRRVTLSICGLGMLDETEAGSDDDLPERAAPVDVTPKPQALGMPQAHLNGAEPPHAEPDQEPKIEVHPFPRDGSKTPRGWKTYAATMARMAQEAPTRDWLMRFQNENVEGLNALLQASAATHEWLSEQFKAVADALREIEAVA